MNGVCISWRSKKQLTVVLSSTETDYMDQSTSINAMQLIKANDLTDINPKTAVSKFILGVAELQ